MVDSKEKSQAGMRERILLLTAILCLGGVSVVESSDTSLLILEGIWGEQRYENNFRELAQGWEKAGEEAGFIVARVSEAEGEVSPKAIFFDKIKRAPAGPLWVVFIGHGAFDGRQAKLQIQGLDITEQELVEAFADRGGELVFLHLGSASGGLVKKLSGEGRVIITATQSYQQRSFAYFTEFFTASLVGDRASNSDLDENGRVSLLEAFLAASQGTEAHYKSLDRLTTEHALLDDNGDGLGSRAEWFDGTTLRRAPSVFLANPDGDRANLIEWPTKKGESALTHRERTIILEIKKLHRQKETLDENEYYRQLEALARSLREERLSAKGSD